MRIIIVGAGVLGTAHAWHAIDRGHEVIHIDREVEARGATVRNFGLVWVSGRSAAELDLSLRARLLWEQIGREVPEVRFRPNGSLTLLRTEAETAVAEEACARPDAQRRGFNLLAPEQARTINPALRGEFVAALHCSTDGAVESRQAMPALRAHLEATGRYAFLGGIEVRAVSSTSIVDDRGVTHGADTVVLCPGAAHGGLLRELAGELPIRRVRLQMMQTDPLDEPLTTAVADGDSLRYYPGFAGPAREHLQSVQPQREVARAHHMQLLCVQRIDGGLTIGDTHEYTEPFAFDVDESPYEHLTEVTESFLGRALPRIRRRWAGVYSQCLDPEEIVCRVEPEPGVHVITGPGGRGMTMSPAIAEQTADRLGW